ncbi:SDR family oxidoreductase [Egibacter rhizosphaerae]|uniref:SDR family oxidoreductase n=1 Tax=Egibacter rhizosphaerae TaxID=1670831 RepID=A0A411YJM0_9ACTN|nr:SDR family NAD(P)-dependent oxidoreductase [Egibacter rhizosphaerae]QBI21369.1 SDR family oxidoreductase [Egibacter rhizosphaerae]
MASATEDTTARRLDLSGRGVLVTGAGRGLGATIAERFALAGARVIVNHRSGDGEAVAEAIRDSGGEAVAVAADVSDDEGPARLAEAAAAELPTLDVLVNAAAAQPLHPWEELDAAAWDAVLAATLRSAFAMTRACEAALVEARGAVVNISSIEARQPMPGHAHYAAAKAGLERLTQAAAVELGPRGVRVNAVAPGLIHREDLPRNWPEGIARYEAAAPLGRTGGADEIADAVVFLASPAAAWITGTTLVVDGGVTAAPSW